MNYAGITIGPIADTMMMTSTPCGLWCASYFFSLLTRALCIRLREKGTDILTLPENHDPKAPMGGAGTYHDRIYFRSEKPAEEMAGLIDACIGAARQDLAKEIDEALGGKDADPSLSDTLQIHYVIFEDGDVQRKGIARTLADALDALELGESSKTEQEANVLRRLLRGTQDDTNANLRRYPPLVRLAEKGSFALARDKGGIELRDLASIARGTSGGKTGKYFAIVQCDGDNMGKVIGGTKEGAPLAAQEKRIRDFSAFCMDYTTAAAEKIAAFGGAMIYAGGDDLLFLAPVYGEGGQNIWTLCREIDETFTACFQKSAFATERFEAPPSVSIGVSINYTSFPLYEAFADARSLLFGTAKGFGAKNNVAVKLRKHSGQTAGFVSRMESGSFAAFLAFLETFVDQAADKDAEDKLIHSVLYHLENQRALFEVALNSCGTDGGQAVRNAFRNVFDNPGQADAATQNRQLADLAVAIDKDFRGDRVKGIDTEDEEGKTAPRLYALTSMLRIIKFLTEEG